MRPSSSGFKFPSALSLCWTAIRRIHRRTLNKLSIQWIALSECSVDSVQDCVCSGERICKVVRSASYRLLRGLSRRVSLCQCVAAWVCFTCFVLHSNHIIASIRFLIWFLIWFRIWFPSSLLSIRSSIGSYIWLLSRDILFSPSSFMRPLSPLCLAASLVADTIWIVYKTRRIQYHDVGDIEVRRLQTGECF